MSMAMKYAMQKRAEKNSKMCHGGMMAEGGEVDDTDMVGRVMRKRMSKGGMVANDTPPIVDSEPADYDDLALRDDLESSYTGANSGDEIGNKMLDEQDEDLVGRIMRSRAKKDRMPRPA